MAVKSLTLHLKTKKYRAQCMRERNIEPFGVQELSLTPCTALLSFIL